MRRTLCICLTVVMFACIALIATRQFQTYEYNQKQFNVEELKTNPDFVGVLQIDGVLSEPVMKSDDGSFYLNHSWDGTPNPKGCVFLDSLYDQTANNIVLYGHNNHDGTVFSDLLNYKESDFAKAHTRLSFQWKDGTKDEYELALVYNFNTDDASKNNPYLPAYPEDYRNRFSYCETYYADKEVSGEIMTLSTCDETLYGQSGRLIVVARKVSS